jgi:glycosyltransferase involved in cell wall biosynthesis
VATKAPRVAIVHDWLVGGGAEQVVYQLHKLYPEAPIYTSYCSDEWRKKLDNKVVTGYLQNWPFSTLRKFIPLLRQHWFGHLDLSTYDLIISSSGNGEAKGVGTPEEATHICYCHSPTHFYWRHYDQYMKQPGFGLLNPFARFGLKMLVDPLRRWDVQAAKLPDYYIANSTHIQNDIQAYYKRDSVVIHPPVNTERFSTAKHKGPRKGFVTLGRQVPFKQTDIIIKACNALGLPLTVMGSGPEHAQLVKLGGPTVRFIERPTDTEIVEHLAGAEAFLFAAYEDFGITPVEAMAAGTPVIGYKAGGALDYIVPGKTGLFFDEQTSESLQAALQKFTEQKFNHGAIATHAEQFSDKKFREHFTEFVEEALHT